MDKSYSIKCVKVASSGGNHHGGIICVTALFGEPFNERITMMMEHDVFKSFKDLLRTGVQPAGTKQST